LSYYYHIHICNTKYLKDVIIPILKFNLETNKDLDMSWIKEEERLQNIQTNYSREPMESIRTYFIYINKNQYIDKILCEYQELGVGSQINKETVLKIIQTKKISTPFSKYKLSDILLYNIDLEPEHIQQYAKSEISNDPLKKSGIESSQWFKKIQIFIACGSNQCNSTAFF
jgi:hypothetical protein